jgi:peroxiredoxin Q/BCP
MSIARISVTLALSIALGTGAAGVLHAQRAQVVTGAADPADTAADPEVGSHAPDFTLPWADKDRIGAADKPFRLQEALGKPVVLAFYPKDFTSGCTAEMKTFTEQYGDLFGSDAVVVGISVDSLSTHRQFADSLGLPFKLLSDPDQRVAKLYASAGSSGYDQRTVYVIDRKGTIAYHNPEFGAIDPQAYADLKAAVEQARK